MVWWLNPVKLHHNTIRTKKWEERPKNKRLSPSSIANKLISTRRKRTRCENAPKEGKVRACDNQPLLGYFNLEWFKVFYFLNKWKESIAIKTENNTNGLRFKLPLLKVQLDPIKPCVKNLSG
jgi:hypothetical protein